MKLKLVVLLCIIFLSCSKPNVETGLDRVSGFSHLFKGKRIGIITNHTARDASNRHITKIFFELKGVTVTALFGPEHGVRGHAEAGTHVSTELDPLKNIPIYSLYGKTRKPTEEMLSKVDVLVFDIQDIGARYYTYIYTMALAMEAAAEQSIPFVVLDRPNPINGVAIEGNILEPAFSTFVGLYPIPVRHGLTVGELATLFNAEGWLKNGVEADLHVIPMGNWRRDKWYDETGLEFIKPSPNMPTLTTAIIYPGTCILEGTNVSEGRGTTAPFEIFGAPWIDGVQLTRRLNSQNLPGITFQDTSFMPIAIAGAAANPKYRDKTCYGALAKITNRDRFQPFTTGIHVVNTIYQMYPDSLQWRASHFDRLCGSSKIRLAIIQNENINDLKKSWQESLGNFIQTRKKYLLYK